MHPRNETEIAVKRFFGTRNLKTSTMTAPSEAQPVPEKAAPPAEKTNGIWEGQYPAKKYKLIAPAKLLRHELMCCGVKEIHGIQNGMVFDHDGHYYNENLKVEELIVAIQKLVVDCNRYRPFWIFSDNNSANKHQVGDGLMQYIIDNKLGHVHRSTEEKNDNSGNKIVVYLWTISRNFLKHKAI